MKQCYRNRENRKEAEIQDSAPEDSKIEAHEMIPIAA